MLSGEIALKNNHYYYYYQRSDFDRQCVYLNDYFLIYFLIFLIPYFLKNINLLLCTCFKLLVFVTSCELQLPYFGAQ